MKRFVALMLVLLGALALVALVGPGLPEGNPLRDLGQSMRDFGGSLGRGFGGGYQPVTP